ncbi:hypothetical protein EFA69_12765 [Rufibacter immobilis]|uniref:Lipoprotein n=1 Tax=Rufibacter immobilis TaxID=1348778 RepID=A0A3M9MTR5_9BACT|nr:hypothetical protein [Rufibacter immobilis]RNI28912.1 hypothetical protein EFA69_12765 [Rufibacter immobilis]
MSLKKFSFLVAVLLIGCSEAKDCDCIGDNEIMIQEASSNKLITQLSRVDHGAFGYDVTLKVCDTSKKLIEAIGLRGEDYLPSIDSIVGKTIYLHYSFPSRHNSKPIDRDIEFESVALGEALIHSESLQFNYIIRNKK